MTPGLLVLSLKLLYYIILYNYKCAARRRSSGRGLGDGGGEWSGAFSHGGGEGRCRAFSHGGRE